MPQTRSTGLASTSTRSPVVREEARRAPAFWPNLARLPATTISERRASQARLVEAPHLRPRALAAPGLAAARMLRARLVAEQARLLGHHEVLGGRVGERRRPNGAGHHCDRQCLPARVRSVDGPRRRGISAATPRQSRRPGSLDPLSERAAQRSRRRRQFCQHRRRSPLKRSFAHTADAPALNGAHKRSAPVTRS